MLQDRVRGKQYESFIDEVVSALRRRYGETLIIHWEDFGVGNSFSLLDRYRDQVRAAACGCAWGELCAPAALVAQPAAEFRCAPQGVCTYNDDIESTAAAVVGALYGAVQVSGVPRLADQHFLFVGAGQASIGSARLVAKALGQEGLSEEEARKRIWLTDSRVGWWVAAKGRVSLHCRLAEESRRCSGWDRLTSRGLGHCMERGSAVGVCTLAGSWMHMLPRLLHCLTTMGAAQE